MNTLREWTDAVCGELQITASEVDRDLVLDLARDVAHSVARPAAPLTAYIAGLAVGRGADGREVADAITRMAEEWGSAANASGAEKGSAGSKQER